MCILYVHCTNAMYILSWAKINEIFFDVLLSTIGPVYSFCLELKIFLILYFKRLCLCVKLHQTTTLIWHFISVSPILKSNNGHSNRQWNSHFIHNINFFSNHFPPNVGPPDIPMNTLFHPQSNASSLKLWVSILYNEASAVRVWVLGLSFLCWS